MRKAVILAAGRGTRMKGLTASVPKPMLPVGGRPLLEHVVERLAEAGIEDVLLIIGYQGEQIVKHFDALRDARQPAAEQRLPERMEYREQQVVNGTGSAALLASSFVGEDDFLLTYGDILASPADYKGLIGTLMDDPLAQAVLGVKWVDDPHQGAAVYEEDGVVTRIVEKPPIGTSTTHWNSAGLYAFRPTLFPELAALTPSLRGEYELTDAITRLILRGARLRHYALQDAWRDVGRPEDLPVAEQLVRSQPL